MQQKKLNSKYCSDKCRSIVQRKFHIEWQKENLSSTQKKEKKVPVKKKEKKTIAEIAVEARAHGMTYGEYVAMLECNGKFHNWKGEG